MERISNDRRKTNTTLKAITQNNHDRSKQLDEAIRILTITCNLTKAREKNRAYKVRLVLALHLIG